MPKQFIYRGYTLTGLQEMSMDDFISLLPSRQNRSFRRGLSNSHRKVIEKIRKLKKMTDDASQVAVRTHCRDLIILPEMVGVTIHVYNGKAFIRVEITPEKIGHYLGEYAVTNTKVRHGIPGIGASRSSMYVPLR
jgi:small subunit ribosomal protein S19